MRRGLELGGGRGKAAIAAVAAFLLLWPSGVLAQLDTETGSHIVRPGPARAPADSLNDADGGRIALPAYAACLVEHDQPEIERIIARFPDEKESKALRQILTGDCLSVGLFTFSHQLLRGALYAELYRRTYSRRAPPIAGISIDWSADAAGQDQDAAGFYVALGQFAECIVQKHPEESRQLMLVPALSHREEDALRAMAPDMGPCLVSGVQLTFSKPILEGLIAEALYRLSAKAAGAAMPTKHAAR